MGLDRTGQGLRTVGVAERRARMAIRHHLAGERAGTVAAAVAGVVALHGTDPASVYLAARARTRNVDKSAIEHALYEERSLVRMLGMRRTVFVVPADLVPVIQAGCTDQIAERLRRQLAVVVQEAGVAPDAATWLKEVGEGTVALLAARGSATGAELAKDEPRLRTQIIAAADNRYGGAVNLTTRLLTVLSAEGLIVRGRPRGGWTSSQFTWSAAPERTDLPASVARAALARRWLTAFGPALPADLQWWTGWTAAQVRQALSSLDIAEVDLGGAPGILLADDQEPLDPDRAVGGAAARSGPQRHGLAGEILVRRRPRGRPVRPVGEHRPDGLVGRPDRGRLGPARGRRDRGPAARRHRSRSRRRDNGRSGTAPRLDRPAVADPGHPALPHAPGTRASQLTQASHRRPTPGYRWRQNTGWSRRRSPLSYLDPTGAMPVISDMASRRSVYPIPSLAFTRSIGHERLIMTSRTLAVHGQNVDSILPR